MYNCIYDGKAICSLDIRNRYEIVKPEVLIKYRAASQAGQLKCPECGGTVVLHAGEQKVPHFKHKKGLPVCPHTSRQESEEHMRAKEMLYYHLKKQHSDARVEVGVRFSFGRRADICVTFQDGARLVVEYQRTDMKVTDWLEKVSAYEDASVRSIWLLSSGRYASNEARYFSELVLSRFPHNTLYFANPQNDTVTISAPMEIKDSDGTVMDREFYSKEYRIGAVFFHRDGYIQSDFDKHFKENLAVFMANTEERLREEKKKDLSQLKLLSDLSVQPVQIKKSEPTFVPPSLPKDTTLQDMLRRLSSEGRLTEAEEIECLCNTNCRKVYEETWEKELQTNEVWLSAATILKIHPSEIPSYLKQNIPPAVMFRCHRTVWQAAILAALVGGETQAKNAAALSKWLRERSAVPLVTELARQPLAGLPTLGEVIYLFLCGLEKACIVRFLGHGTGTQRQFILVE